MAISLPWPRRPAAPTTGSDGAMRSARCGLAHVAGDSEAPVAVEPLEMSPGLPASDLANGDGASSAAPSPAATGWRCVTAARSADCAIASVTAYSASGSRRRVFHAHQRDRAVDAVLAMLADDGPVGQLDPSAPMFAGTTPRCTSVDVAFAQVERRERLVDLRESSRARRASPCWRPRRRA